MDPVPAKMIINSFCDKRCTYTMIPKFFIVIYLPLHISVYLFDLLPISPWIGATASGPVFFRCCSCWSEIGVCLVSVFLVVRLQICHIVRVDSFYGQAFYT